jgi:large subunit ribosomal protein L3
MRKRIRIMGKKCGMVQHFNEEGNALACTLILVEPNVIAQIKTTETDGYQALQLGSGAIKAKNVKKPVAGHFTKAGVKACRHLQETRVEKVDGYEIGQTLGVELFDDVTFVDVQSVSKGKGYQGTMKLHGFGGGPAAHGSGFHRHGGSTGMRSTPGRCFPGGKRASRMGGDVKTVQSLKIVAIDKERNFVLVAGSVPGAKGAHVTISPAVKK